MRAWSGDFKRLKWTGKCPHCGNWHPINLIKAIRSWKLFDGQGQPLFVFTPVWKFPQGTYAVCQKCGYKVVAFAADQVHQGAPAPGVRS